MANSFYITDLADPQLSDLQRAALAAATAHPVTLTEEAVLEAARQATGLSDFGDDSFRDRLAGWVRAAREQTNLSPVGQAAIWGDMVRYLVARLQFEDFAKRHPGISEVPLPRPIIVGGLPRSGTTNLLQLLAGDPRLRSLPYWEAIRPVGEFYMKDGVDQRHALCAAEWAQRDELMPVIKSIHEFSPDHISEDVELAAMDFGTYWPDWAVRGTSWVEYEATHDRVPWLAYMRRVMQGLSYQRGPNQWVSKCPQHMEQLDAVMKVFPDATMVLTHRDPVASVQSMLTAAAYSARLTCKMVDKPGIIAFVVDRYERLMRRCVEQHDSVPSDQMVDIYFHEYMADRDGTLEKVYDAAGLPFDDATRQAIDAVAAHNKRGRHGQLLYDLRGDFGIDPAELRKRFDFYMDRFPVAIEVK